MRVLLAMSSRIRIEHHEVGALALGHRWDLGLGIGKGLEIKRLGVRGWGLEIPGRILVLSNPQAPTRNP
jgi:hypothetical protein